MVHVLRFCTPAHFAHIPGTRQHFLPFDRPLLRHQIQVVIAPKFIVRHPSRQGISRRLSASASTWWIGFPLIPIRLFLSPVIPHIVDPPVNQYTTYRDACQSIINIWSYEYNDSVYKKTIDRLNPYPHIKNMTEEIRKKFRFARMMTRQIDKNKWVAWKYGYANLKAHGLTEEDARESLSEKFMKPDIGTVRKCSGFQCQPHDVEPGKALARGLCMSCYGRWYKTQHPEHKSTPYRERVKRQAQETKPRKRLGYWGRLKVFPTSSLGLVIIAERE